MLRAATVYGTDDRQVTVTGHTAAQAIAAIDAHLA